MSKIDSVITKIKELIKIIEEGFAVLQRLEARVKNLEKKK